MISNAHTHLELSGLGALCPVKPMPLVYWMLRLVKRLRYYEDTDFQDGLCRGIAALKRYGTTHVGDISVTWQVEALLQSGLRGVVYLEVLGLKRSAGYARLADAQRMIRRARQHRESGAMQVGLSLHAPYSCHPDLLRHGAAWCREEGVPLCIHVAESPLEIEYLLTGRVRSLHWPMRMLIQLLALGAPPAPRLRAVAFLQKLGVLAARPLLVHGVQVCDAEIRMLADHGCAVVHCPRSNTRLACGRMPLERYLDAGVRVYLGTDSLASSPDLDVTAEAAFARRLHQGRVRPEDVDRLPSQAFP